MAPSPTKAKEVEMAFLAFANRRPIKLPSAIAEKSNSKRARKCEADDSRLERQN